MKAIPSFNAMAVPSAKCAAMTLLVFGVVGGFNIFALLVAIFAWVGLDGDYDRWACWKIALLPLHILAILSFAAIAILCSVIFVITFTDRPSTLLYQLNLERICLFAMTVICVAGVIISVKTYSNYGRVYSLLQQAAYPYIPPPLSANFNPAPGNVQHNIQA